MVVSAVSLSSWPGSRSAVVVADIGITWTLAGSGRVGSSDNLI